MGIPEAVMDSVRRCPPEVMPHLLPNIIAVGGCALFPGMQKRLEMEIRSLAPDDCSVNVTVPEKYSFFFFFNFNAHRPINIRLQFQSHYLCMAWRSCIK